MHSVCSPRQCGACKNRINKLLGCEVKVATLRHMVLGFKARVFEALAISLLPSCITAAVTTSFPPRLTRRPQPSPQTSYHPLAGLWIAR